MTPRPRWIDGAALVGFTVLWLVPVAIVAALGAPPAGWPTQARDLYAVSCLFGQVHTRVSMFYVQVRYAERPGWYDLDEHEHFGLEPFGHRTRFDRFMVRFAHQPESIDARRELAEWLAAREAERHGERGHIVALRYIWADHEISPDAPPEGRWRKPPRAEAGRIHQLGDIVVIDGDRR